MRQLLLLLLVLPAWAFGQTSYTWTGAAGTAWNNAANWSPNTGFPLAADHATIVSTANAPSLDANRSVTNLTVSSGTLNLAGRTLTFTGNGSFSGGAVNNGTLTANNTTGTVTFAGTTFGANISGATGILLFNGSVFNGTVALTKNSGTTDLCTGGNTFNNTLTLTVSSGRLYLNNTGVDAFNGDLILNCTASGAGYWFGNNTGSCTLASGRTLTVGGGGFSVGSLALRNFTQAGTTAQSFTLTGAATLYFQTGVTFNGDLACASPALYLNGSVFNGAAKFTKTGASNEYSSGGDTYNGATEFVVTAAGTLYLFNTGNDQFNGNLLLNSTGTGGIRMGQATGTGTLAPGRTMGIGSSGWSAGALSFKGFTQASTTTTVFNLSGTAQFATDAGTVLNGNLVVSSPTVMLNAGTFNGNARFTKTSAATDDWGIGGCTFNGSLELTNTTTAVFCVGNTASDQYNGNLIVNNTSSGSVRFGNASTTSTETLAAGKTISVGGTGFSNGALILHNFIQNGSTAQVLTLSGTASLMLNKGNVFGGSFNATAASVTMTNNTFNGAAKFNKTGTSIDGSMGGNTFSSTAEFNVTGTGAIYMADAGTDTYNGDILVTSTTTGQIRFGNGGGFSNLASGHAIAVGPAGFAGGMLLLHNFTQAGPTSQTLSLATGAALYLQGNNVFNGPVTTTSGMLILSGSTFNGASKFTKTGSSGDGEPGGNMFNSSVELVNTNTGYIYMGETNPDQYNGDILLNNTSPSGQIRFGSSGLATSTLAAGHTIAAGSTGFNTGLLLLRNFAQLGSTPQTLNVPGASLYYYPGTVFNGNVTSTSGSLYFWGTTFNGTGKFTKAGSSGDGSPGGNTFNGNVELVNTNTGYIYMGETNPDQYNGDILLNNTSPSGQIRFGSSGLATSTLAAGHTIAAGSTGFNTGQLLLRNFIQVGATPQTLNVAGTQLYYYPGTVFNGDLTSTSGSLYFWGTTFNGTSKFTKTGSSGDASPGGNTFNGTVELVNTTTGSIYMAESTGDQYNNDLVLNNLTTGSVRFGSSGLATSTLAAGRTVSIGAQGFGTGLLMFRKFVQLGTTAQTLVLPTGQLYYYPGTVFNGDLTSTSGSLLFWGTTFNGTGKFTKTGTSTDASTGGNTFNGTAELVNTLSGSIYMADQGGDTYNGDLLLSNTSTGQIRFGNGAVLGLTSTLASGRSVSVGALGFNAGMLSLRNFIQLGGTPQNLVLGTAATLAYHQGSTFNGQVTSTSGSLFFYGTTFNADSWFTKSGATGDASWGGNVFNGSARFDQTAAGVLSLDQINGADNFNGDILLGNTSTGQITFGQNTGSAVLAAGHTISVGALGFNSGQLAMRSFTQLGSTPQNLTLGVNAQLRFDPGCTFNGNVVSTSGSLFLTGSTFNGTGKFTKTGPANDNSNGANVFNGTTEFILAGSGNLGLDCYTGVDHFNSDLVLNCTGTGQLGFGQISGSAILAAGRTVSVGSLAFNSGTLYLRAFTQLGTTPQNLVLGNGANLRFDAGTVFNGDLTTTSGSVTMTGSTFNGNSKFTKTGPSGDNSNGSNVFNGTAEFVLTTAGTFNLDCYTGTDLFNGDVLVENTSTGQIGFGVNSGFAVLAAGHTISAGALGFNTGTLYVRNFTQLGSAPQTLLLGNAAALRFETGNTFNGPVTSVSGNLLFNGTTFNSTGKFTKTSSSNDNSNGGNVFNGTAEFIMAGTGILAMDCYTGTDRFNGDLVFNSTSTGNINFGTVSGSAILAAGGAMSVGGLGFASGGLSLRNFQQIGATPQALPMTGTSSLTFLSGTVIGGPITTTSGDLLLSGATFNGTSSFTKTGANNNASAGGNVFNGDMELRVPGGPFTMATAAADDFNGNVSFIRTGAGSVVVCNTFNTTFSRNVSTVGSTASVQFGAGTGRMIFDGNTVQQFSSDAAYPPQVRNLTVNKSGGTLDLLGDVVVTTDMAFTNGVVRPQAATSTSNGLLIINNGVTFSDAADVGSYVDGFLRKIGNAAFTFPVGNAGILAPITMSAPSIATHHFTAKYVHLDPTPTYNTGLHDASLQHISHCEYWIMDRTGGTSNVTLTLSWENVRSCGVTDLTQLAVAHWNGSTWKDEGHGAVTGNTANGTIATWAPVTYFSPFTLASFSVDNPLPIELLNFTAQPEGDQVRTAWVTATERNNERFEVERSADGEAFEAIGTEPGAGDSQSELHYTLLDEHPLPGLSYYRLKQVDFDGVFTYSDVVPVHRGSSVATGMYVFPNPTSAEATVAIHGLKEGHLGLTVLNAQGQVVSAIALEVAAGDIAVPVSLDGWPVGIYLVRIERADGQRDEIRLIKQ